MSANNEVVIIKKGKVWAIYDEDVEIKNASLPIGIVSSLETAIDVANEYMSEHEVEYGLRIIK
jgi:hypothetical protein